LFDRFYAVVDGSGKLQQHGTLSMLQALAQKDYIKLQYTNNLITKYAFIVPNEQLGTLLGVTDTELLLLERAKMTAARFFPGGDKYGNAALQLFVSRLATMDAIQDLADVFGKEIRFDMLRDLASVVSTTVPPAKYQEVQGKLNELTQ
jgi:glutamine synthetase adenylyltransferase